MQMCLPAGVRISCPGDAYTADTPERACSTSEGVRVYSVVLTGGSGRTWYRVFDPGTTSGLAQHSMINVWIYSHHDAVPCLMNADLAAEEDGTRRYASCLSFMDDVPSGLVTRYDPSLSLGPVPQASEVGSNRAQRIARAVSPYFYGLDG